MVAISHDESACKNSLLPIVRSRRLVFYRGENQKISRSLRLPVDCIAFQPFRPLCFLSPLLLPGAMAAQQITESEVTRLTQELQAKDAELGVKEVELRELKEETSAMPKSGSRRELLLPSRAPFIHPA